MTRVLTAFEAVQVIRVLEHLANKPLLLGRNQGFEFGKERRVPRTHISENNSASFAAGIGQVTDLCVKIAAGRFPRLLKAASVDVKEPAVVNAPQPAVFDSPVSMASVLTSGRTRESARSSTPMSPPASSPTSKSPEPAAALG